MSMKNYMLNWGECEKSFITSGPVVVVFRSGSGTYINGKPNFEAISCVYVLLKITKNYFKNIEESRCIFNCFYRRRRNYMYHI